MDCEWVGWWLFRLFEPGTLMTLKTRSSLSSLVELFVLLYWYFEM